MAREHDVSLPGREDLRDARLAELLRRLRDERPQTYETVIRLVESLVYK